MAVQTDWRGQEKGLPDVTDDFQLKKCTKTEVEMEALNPAQFQLNSFYFYGHRSTEKPNFIIFIVFILYFYLLMVLNSPIRRENAQSGNLGQEEETSHIPSELFF